jgi:CheY-like chemotaxis protein
MPRLTGVELARRLKAIRPEIPVVLTTGYGDPLAAMPAGSAADAVAAKPFVAAELARTLRRLLDGD